MLEELSDCEPNCPSRRSEEHVCAGEACAQSLKHFRTMRWLVAVGAPFAHPSFGWGRRQARRPSAALHSVGAPRQKQNSKVAGNSSWKCWDLLRAPGPRGSTRGPGRSWSRGRCRWWWVARRPGIWASPAAARTERASSPSWWIEELRRAETDSSTERWRKIWSQMWKWRFTDIWNLCSQPHAIQHQTLRI